MPDHEAGPGLGLATWNVESIRAHHDQVVGWVERRQPGLVCLQETKCGPAGFPRRAFEALGYELIAHGGADGQGGVAVAVHGGADDVVTGIPGAVAPLAEPRLIALTWRGLRVTTVYAPNGRKVGTRPHAVKLAWFQLLRAWLALDREHHPASVLLGDLNIAPTDADVWEPARYRNRNLTSRPERAAFAALVADGLVDVVRDHHPDRPAYTWWNRRGDFYATDRGWRLDHVLADPATAARVTSVLVDRAERATAADAGPGVPCDHAPILVTLDS